MSLLLPQVVQVFQILVPKHNYLYYYHYNIYTRNIMHRAYYMLYIYIHIRFTNVELQQSCMIYRVFVVKNVVVLGQQVRHHNGL